jgi:hypothetical protein
MQYDAAVDPKIARQKVKGASAVAGRATVCIFPNLDTGNNTYKVGVAGWLPHAMPLPAWCSAHAIKPSCRRLLGRQHLQGGFLAAKPLVSIALMRQHA